MQRAAEGLDPVARLEVGAFAQALDDLHHRLPVQHAGDVVGDGRGGLAPAAGGEVGKDQVGDRTPDIGEGVSVEEEKRGATVTTAEKLERFGQSQDLLLFAPPLCRKRSVSL